MFIETATIVVVVVGVIVAGGCFRRDDDAGELPAGPHATGGGRHGRGVAHDSGGGGDGANGR